MNYIFIKFLNLVIKKVAPFIFLGALLIPTSVFAVNFTPLTNAINSEYTDGANRSTLTLVQTDFTSGTWNTYIRAVTVDAVLIEGDFSSTQSDINNMVTIIANAKANLVFISASNLVSAINASSSKIQSDYSTTSWVLFQSAVVLAHNLPQTTNSEAISKTNAITSAIALLTTDKTQLTQTLTTEIGTSHVSPVYTASSSDYTSGSWATFVSSINSALIIEASTTVSQAGINNAINLITASKSSLVLLSLKEISSFSFSVGIQSIQENNLSIFASVPTGTDVSNLVATFITTGASVTVSSTTQLSGVTSNNFTLPVVYTVTAADASTKNYTVYVKVLNSNEISQNLNGTSTLSASSTQVVLIDQSATTTVVVSTSTVNPTLNANALLSNGTATLPAINISTNLSSIHFPQGVKIVSSSSTWDGIFSLPTTTTITLPSLTGFTKSASLTLMNGLLSDSLYFNKGVRMVYIGEAGKRIAFAVGSGTVTEIVDICSTDTQATGDALSTYGECKIDVGSDLVVWTKHFTTFVTYTQTSTSINVGGGGGGGGGSSSGVSNSSVSSSITNNSVITPTLATVQTLNKSIGSIDGEKQVLGVSSFNFFKNLKLSSKGKDVTELQKLLISQGILTGKPTGYFGTLTKKALITWQKLNSIPSTGYFGPLSRAVMNKANI